MDPLKIAEDVWILSPKWRNLDKSGHTEPDFCRLVIYLWLFALIGSLWHWLIRKGWNRHRDRGNKIAHRDCTSNARDQCDQILKYKSCPNVSAICLKISTAVFTLWGLFQSSPKVNNPFGILLKTNLLPRTFKNRPIWSHCTRRMDRILADANDDKLA